MILLLLAVWLSHSSIVIVGAHVMLGGGSMVSQDVPPYVMAQGNHARPFGVNIEGLKRRGFADSRHYMQFVMCIN